MASQVLDQLQLPEHTEYIDILEIQDAYDAIRSMQVRESLTP